MVESRLLGIGVGWLVFAIIAVAMIGGMAMMGRMLMRHGSPRPTWDAGNHDEEPPEQILARRLASGEIDVEEFIRLRDSLHPASTSPADPAEPSGAGPNSPKPDRGAF